VLWIRTTGATYLKKGGDNWLNAKEGRLHLCFQSKTKQGQIGMKNRGQAKPNIQPDQGG